MLAEQIAYLTSDAALTSPFVSSFRVREVLPAETRALSRALRERGIGRLEIKKRGVDIDPAAFRTALKLRGDESATLILTRIGLEAPRDPRGPGAEPAALASSAECCGRQPRRSVRLAAKSSQPAL